MNDECNKCPYHKVAFLKEEHPDVEFLIKEKHEALKRVKELEDGIREHRDNVFRDHDFLGTEINYADKELYKLLEGK